MLRPAASLLVAVSFASCGFLFWRLQRERVVLLRLLDAMAAEIMNRLRYGCEPIPDLLLHLAVCDNFARLSFLNTCSAALQKGQPLKTAWESGLNNDKISLLLPRAAAQLTAFGATLGATDLQGQILHCERFASFLSVELKRQEQSERRAAKLYPPLGLLAGIGMAMMIL